LTRLASYTFDEPVDIALDPDDWQSAWVLTENSVLHTPDAGETWFDVTADLGLGGAGAQDFNTIAFIPRSSASIIAVGASDGLYATDTAQLSHWYKLGGALPNAVVQDLEYDACDDVLLVATLGRSTWLVRHAQSPKAGGAYDSHVHRRYKRGLSRHRPPERDPNRRPAGPAD
jgi:photosystem II stability/assembly factor-like uncharacterized protein